MKNQDASPHHQQAGSIFVWILIMISLFAALSYTLIQNGRTNASQLTEQQARLAATELVDYTQRIKDGVKEAIINGCADTTLSFENDVFILNNNALAHPASLYPLSPANNSCDIFHAQGQNLKAVVFQESQISVPHAGGARTGNSLFVKVIVPNVGTALPDLVMIIPCIQRNVCAELNKMLSIDPTGAALPLTTSVWSAYDNNFTAADSFTANFSGITSACFNNNAGADNSNHFYQVLIAR